MLHFYLLLLEFTILVHATLIEHVDMCFNIL